MTYSGDLINLVGGYPSWTPTSTYTGGPVGNAPTPSGGILQLVGGTQDVNTITFSSAVTNPALAIWSLGNGSTPASFDFIGSVPTIVAGGPSAEYGGGGIFPCPLSVCGVEGNGTVVFSGTYTSISWQNPGGENWFGVTAGVAATPEPGFYALLGLGLGGLAVVRWKLSRNS